MPLTLAQRLDRLRARMAELSGWQEHAAVPIEGWTIDGCPIALKEVWPDRIGVHRFNASVTVPSEWPLEDVRLSLDLGGESLLALQYDDGQEARFGLDPNHRLFPLKGRSFTISSESTARLPFGEPVREPKLNEARLVWIESAIYQLHMLFEQIALAVKALGDHEVVPHMLALAEKAFYSLDWPSATDDYVARIAHSEQQQRIWELPALKQSPAGLTREQSQTAARVYATLLSDLMRLQGRYPQQGTIMGSGHAHIDLCWLWPYSETRLKTRRTFSTALELMERFPGFYFNQSTAAYYAQLEEDDPALFERIKARVKEGRWEAIGGMWVEPDNVMPSGESLVRQVLYGQRYFQKTFGVRHTVGWMPDCFGFSGALPQILKQGGLKSFFTIKVYWSETNLFPHDLFWWEGVDGSKVLTHIFCDPFSGYNSNLGAESIHEVWKAFRAKTIHDESLLTFGYGDGGGGVTAEMLGRAEQLQVFPALPKIKFGRVDALFNRFHATAAVKPLPVWSGEMYFELHRGTLTSQGRTKWLHRHAERALVTAETVGSLATLLGASRPVSLERLWRLVLKNEFHDILPGSSIHEVYDDAESDLGQVISAARDKQVQSLQAIIGRLEKGDVADALVIVNPSLSPQPLRFDDGRGRVIASTEVVPPLGILVVDCKTIEPVTGLSITPGLLENAFVRVEIGADGSIARLYDKVAHRDALEGRGNQLWVYPADKPRNWDAWDLEEDYARKAEELTDVQSVEIVENGAHRVSLRIVRTFRSSTITQILSLWANSPRLDIRTDIDWHERRVLLRALFPVAVRSDHVTYECAFGVQRRPTHTNTSWDEAKFEVAGHRFADLSEPGFGVALLNDGKYGHSGRGNVLGLSLLRSPVYPDPLADEGQHSFSYALFPHRGAWHEARVREEAEDLNQPLLVCKASGLKAGVIVPLTVGGVTAGLGTLKASEDGDDLILRLFEPAGARGSLKIGLPAGWELGEGVSILEEPMKREGESDLMPFEIRSWRLRKR